MKKRTIGILLVSVLIIGGIWYSRTHGTKSTVTTDVVRRGDVVQTVSVTGTLTPTSYADLSFQTVGSVDLVLAKEGDAVKAGQAIATLDTSVLESQLRAAKIAADIAYQNELVAKQSHLKSAEVEAKRLASEQARQQIHTLTMQIADGTIGSPIDGTLSKLDLRVGETAVMGRVIAHVVGGGSELLAETKVPESDIAKVAVGMKAKVTFDALTTQDIFPADVIEIKPVADNVQDVVSYIVKLRVANMDRRLREGMTANVDIETAKGQDAVVAPFRVLSKENGKTLVELERGVNLYEKVPVTTGIEGDDGMVEIKSGLKEGDVYVVSKK